MHLNACDICKKMIFGDYASIEYRSQEPGRWKRYDVCHFCFRKNPFFKRFLPAVKNNKAKQRK